MEQRNEPTTAEIASAIRCFLSHTEKTKPCGTCRYGDGEGLCRFGMMMKDAADRLELLERELADQKKWHENSMRTASDNIAALERQLAAEKARADAAVADLKDSYVIGEHDDGTLIYDCALCMICRKIGEECDCPTGAGEKFEYNYKRGAQERGEGAE